MSAAVGLQSSRLVVAHPQWWLGLMLLALHAALAWGIMDWWPRAFLLAHFPRSSPLHARIRNGQG